MEKIGVVGAGNMGSGIAQKSAQEGLKVILVDIEDKFVKRGLDGIKATLNEGIERKLFSPDQVEKIMERIEGTTDLSKLKDVDLVIEAVFEDMQVKKDLFSKLDEICNPETVLATNTSSFSVTELSGVTKRPEKFVGLHFFYHPAKNRLLEIIPGEKTSEDTIAKCRKFATLSGKTDILVKDAPGFAVNRFFVPWLNEATRILGEGIANIPTIDKAAMDAFGIGMGPFKLMNVTGIPIAYHSTMTLGEKLGEFYAPSKTLKAQFESNQLWDLEGEVDDNKIEQVGNRLLAVVFFVCGQLLEEKVASMEDIDLGAKVGLRWRKGPFEMMNKIGLAKVGEMVEELLSQWLGVKVPEILLTQSKKGEPWDIRYVRHMADNAISRVVISRPEAMNALNQVVVSQLDDAISEAISNATTKAIVIEGKGKAFVAGADIGFFIKCIKQGKLDDIVSFTSYGQEVLNKIDDSPKQVIVKMDGLALGGGLELALSADVIVATKKAKMGFPETGIGIYPGLGGTQRTSRFVGPEIAKYLIFTGRILSVEEAKEIGLIDYIFNDDEVDEKIESMIANDELSPNKGAKDAELSDEWKKIKEYFTAENIEKWLNNEFLDHEDPFIAKTAKIISKKAPIALRLANQIIDEGIKLPLKEGLKLELDHLKEIFSTEDALTGLSSVGRSRPEFKGK